jgi:hypothetical protein
MRFARRHALHLSSVSEDPARSRFWRSLPVLRRRRHGFALKATAVSADGPRIRSISVSWRLEDLPVFIGRLSRLFFRSFGAGVQTNSPLCDA